MVFDKLPNLHKPLLVIVITDGEPDDRLEAQQAIQTCRQRLGQERCGNKAVA